jgi:hypothetical protein
MRSQFVMAGVLASYPLFGACGYAAASEAPLQPATSTAAPATTILISDLHLGVGRKSNGDWDPTEDARWPDALSGFLRSLPASYPEPIDLVVLGDFLELWQPPAAIPCAGPSGNPDEGCSIAEASALVNLVLSQHKAELAALTEFASNKTHRLIIVPGNHDAALMVPSVWNIVSQALSPVADRVVWVSSGYWTSPDGSVYAEHGHQIGHDVNRFADWPAVTKQEGGVEYLVRPWGQRFVQKVFNDVEAQYPIIDNLSPESVGARYRIAAGGPFGAPADIAKFLTFNLFETSITQKVKFLGNECPPSTACDPVWDLKAARRRGPGLYINALDDQDPMRALLLEDSAQGKSLRGALEAEVNALSDTQVKQLCDVIAVKSTQTCAVVTAGFVWEKLVKTKEQILRERLLQLGLQRQSAKYYVYAHTHQLEVPWQMDVTQLRHITVANTGAWQRVGGEDWFKRQLKKRNISDKDALKSIALEDFPACYTFVAVRHGDKPSIETRQWHKSPGAAGSSVEPGDPLCE